PACCGAARCLTPRGSQTPCEREEAAAITCTQGGRYSSVSDTRRESDTFRAARRQCLVSDTERCQTPCERKEVAAITCTPAGRCSSVSDTQREAETFRAARREW